ncbi:hypothetical protein EVAR_36831_1 [Eumeta japonica]|uniref:Uncharacterized protein n=1 Tax=Eumeta variegata TaxID=151549 RepID=A0A4C1WE10_EUMVA|nr:hypothetical protein EVAR_36831_1 [Eumeta japonica]
MVNILLLSYSTILTSETLRKAELNRQEELVNAQNRMMELEKYNIRYVVGRQRKRSRLVANLYVDDQLHPNVIDALQLRDAAIRNAKGAGGGDNKKK